MSADYSDMLARIQLAMAQQNTNPTFAGLQAPVDPSRMQNLVNSLKQQQYLQQSLAPTPGMGGFGALMDAGKQGFVQAGLTMGNMIGNAIGAAPGQQPRPQINPTMQQMPPPQQSQQPGAPGQPQAAPGGGQAATNGGQAATGGQVAPAMPQAATGGQQQGGSPTPPGPNGTAPGSGLAAYSAAIMKAKQAFSSMITAGVDPDVAKVNSLKMLVAAGIPGADVQLEAASSAVLKNQSTQAETAKNTGEAGSYQSNAQNQQFDQSTKQWKTTFTDPNGLYMIQTNGQGQQQRVELKPPPTASAQAAASLSPDSIQFAADTYRATGKFPGAFGRSPAMQAVVLNKVSADALANGDTAGAIAARTGALKANGVALDQVTKQETMTGSFVNTMESNLQALQKIGANLGSTGSPLFNKVLNHFNQGIFTDPTTASYVVMLNSVASEFAKIQSGSMGNTPVSDASRQEARDTINKAMSQGGIAAVAQTMRQEAANRMQAIHDTKQGLLGSMGVNAPSANGTAKPSGTAPTSVRTYNPQTGTFQ